MSSDEKWLAARDKVNPSGMPYLIYGEYVEGEDNPPVTASWDLPSAIEIARSLGGDVVDNQTAEVLWEAAP